MTHLIDLIESYARHYLLEQHGYRSDADERFSRLHSAIATHSQAVSRSSVVAYREGRQGSPASPAYHEWELEAWRSGVADSASR